MTDILIQRLSPDAIIPSYTRVGDAGLDLSAIEYQTVEPQKVTLVSTGIMLAIPEGFEGQIRSRSGIALNHQVFVLNSPGTVDCNYRGEIKIILYNLSQSEFFISPGDRIAQLVICPVVQANTIEATQDLSHTVRGTAGFGSSGGVSDRTVRVLDESLMGQSPTVRVEQGRETRPFPLTKTAPVRWSVLGDN